MNLRQMDMVQRAARPDPFGMHSASPIRRLVLVPAAPAAKRPGVRRLVLARRADIFGPELLPAAKGSQGARALGVRAP